MAAESVRSEDVRVHVFDAMPSVGRKLLLAGKGGLNLTHAEPACLFLSRYGGREGELTPLLSAFDATAVRTWAGELGISTIVGTSGRVFPTDFKAAPLLRAWLRRLRSGGVTFHLRHRWCGWDESGGLRFETPQGIRAVSSVTTILALGGASWPKTGSDGSWVPFLKMRGIDVAPLRPANCGFDVNWSDHIRERFEGCPVKAVEVSAHDASDLPVRRQGQFVVTKYGVEGGVIYSIAALLRDRIDRAGSAMLHLDLSPDRDLTRLVTDLSRPRGKRTVATHLQRYAGIEGVKSALLREVVPKEDFGNPVSLARAIKSLPIKLTAARPVREAISTAGGVRFEGLDEWLMFRQIHGVFCAGEMLDWEAPTGGYLLTACLASGRAAGIGAARWMRLNR